VVEVLLAHGSNVHLIEDRYDQTALHVCGTHGHAFIAKMIIDAGGDPHLKDSNGNSFYDIATAVGSAISPSDLKKYLGW
jgi:ankyrin repeat protein